MKQESEIVEYKKSLTQLKKEIIVVKKLEPKTKFDVFSNFFSVISIIFPRKTGTVNGVVNGAVNKGVNLLFRTIKQNPGLRTNAYSKLLNTSQKNIER